MNAGTPNRHAQMVEAAVWLAGLGFADIGWAPAPAPRVAGDPG